jgi:UDPglucose 6-dehydrogenase
MRICVYGLWHLGTVMSTCLAEHGYEVTGLDEDPSVVADLSRGKAPLFEPGLDAHIMQTLITGRLRYTTDSAVVSMVDVLWVAFDTPVDDEDSAKIEYVIDRVELILPQLPLGCLVIISSQLPVGSIARFENFVKQHLPEKKLHFACCPENLRLGKAISAFMHPDRIVVGYRAPEAKELLAVLIGAISSRIEWMSIESAEMTKHALNAFLAVSIAFANELASICEKVGADAKEIERGLKSDKRIGPGAYLAPGGAFSGGTLARDIDFLGRLVKARSIAAPLLQSVKISNENHKSWPFRKLAENFTNLHGIVVAIWGLTYKPGTSTLRRSQSVDLCNWLLNAGVKLLVHDPKVVDLPAEWAGRVLRCADPLEAVSAADALIVGTEWPEYRVVAHDLPNLAKAGMIVIDANRHLGGLLTSSKLRYVAVGVPQTSAI